jgi:hypothetical protein
MYIQHLKIDHLKRLRDFELDFRNPDGTPRMWTVLIGENGTAKTSILQAIAMATAGSLHVNELAGKLVPHLRDRRQPRSTMTVEGRFGFGAQGSAPQNHRRWDGTSPLELVSSVALSAGQSSLIARSRYSAGQPSQERDPLQDARAAPPPAGWLVVGIGTTRLPPEPGAATDLSRPSISRVRPLMDPRTPLTSTSFLSHFGARSTKARQFSRMLQSVLIGTRLLPDDITRLELRGHGGVTRAADLVEREKFTQRMGDDDVKVPLIAFANGLQSTIGWVAEFLGHALLDSDESVEPGDIEGLVLLDEIDLYLHPTWQVSLVRALRNIFPKTQFVVTTHSPAMLAACKPEEIVRMRVDGESGIVDRVAPHPDSGLWEPIRKGGDPTLQEAIDPRMLTGSELYQYYFGLDGVTLRPEGEKVRRYHLLATDPSRREDEEAEVLALRQELIAAGFELPAPVTREPR